ncbi:MAG: GEVED domain-containing protein [Candidatus Eisenbacteria bacterium]
MNCMARLLVCMAALCAFSFTLPQPALAHDVDGPDCGQQRQDFGDAPEGVLAYPGVLGRFPTCTGLAFPSTLDITCPPISAPPGPSGYVRHLLFGDNYWLGCYGAPGVGPSGIDSDPDGKTNQPATGFSACGQFPTDCVEAAFGLTFDQDECYADGSDAGVKTPPSLIVCETSTVTFDTYNCTPAPRQAYLNILVDMNQDGDWNDNFACNAGTCAYEWAVKNVVIAIPPGCVTQTSPAFLVGPQPGPGWMRITICDEPVFSDFPWHGSMGMGGGLHNGETEDYPVDIQIRTPALPSSWGRVKSLYRG